MALSFQERLLKTCEVGLRVATRKMRAQSLIFSLAWGDEECARQCSASLGSGSPELWAERFARVGLRPVSPNEAAYSLSGATQYNFIPYLYDNAQYVQAGWFHHGHHGLNACMYM